MTLLLLVTVASFVLNGGLALAAAAVFELARGAGTLLLVLALLGAAAAAALGAQVVACRKYNEKARPSSQQVQLTDYWPDFAWSVSRHLAC